MNSLQRFSIGIIMLWMAGSCLAQPVYYDTLQTLPFAPPPGGSDQQTQAKDLTGKLGKLQVDDFTGSFGYSVPIACAPARNGSQPSLALTYSSKGQNGWCGVGWKLDIGYIERNTQNGIPIPYSAHFPLKQYDDSKGFILNLFGRELKLLAAATNGTLVEYRAEVDTDFLRCVLDTSNNKWLVYDKSGTVYYFGQTGSSRVANPKSGWGTTYTATFQWGLDQIDTATGDRTTVAYATSASPYTSQQERTVYPTTITYNSHPSASYAGTHTISFGMEARPDWRFSYRWGFRTEQSRRLTDIVCQAGGQQVWHYALSYGTSPATKRSLLKTVTVYGSDDNNPLPIQTFTYQGNTNGVSFGPTVQWGGFTAAASPVETFITQQAGGSAIADLVDIDGDGLPDWVVYPDTSVLTRTNRYLVQHNTGKSGANSFGQQISFGPTSTGGGGTPSASNPIPDGDPAWAGLNTSPHHIRLRDINGDGLPDRVCDWWNYIPGTANTFTNFMVMTNTGSGFATSATAWSVSDGPAVAGSDLQYYQQVESGGVNSGFFDINGDGLPDRVLSRHYMQGPMTNFWVQFNTGSSFTTTNFFGPYTSQNWNTNVNSYVWAGIEIPNEHMVDLNGDGLPDRVMVPINPSSPANPLTPVNLRTNFMVEYNDGYSFECTNAYNGIGGGADVWPGVNPQYPNSSSWEYYAQVQNLPYVGLYDLNGDGLPDRVMLDHTTALNNSTNKSWLIYLNNGHGFDTAFIRVTNILDQSIGSGNPNDVGWWGPQSSYGDGSVAVTLMDINGDGLLDRVMTVYGNSGPTPGYFLVQTNIGPCPDLLTSVSNGIGGSVAVAYLPSTAYPNYRDPANTNSGSTLPFPQYTVTTVIKSDSINPPRTNSYGYGGGFYDGSRREFAGFAVVTNTDPTLRKMVTYFHTGGGRNYSALGEYQDTNNFAKRGKPYRIETYGNDNNLYKVVISQVNQINFANGRYFPFVQLTLSCDYTGTGSSNITAAKFVYDASTGNLTNKIFYGQVNGFSPNNVGSFSFTDADGTDTQLHKTHYAAISGNTNILDHPDTATLTDTNNNVIRETDYTYNPSSGTIATRQTRISSGYYATTSYGNYNSYGLVGLITDPVGVQTTITYDGTYNIYPATTRIRKVPGSDGGSDLVTTTSYDVRSGLAAGTTDPTGVTVTNFYDNFCRLTESDKIPVGGTTVWMRKLSYALGGIASGLSTNYVHAKVNDGVDSVNGIESRTYADGFGRPIETKVETEVANQYRVINTAYDGRGNALLTTWPIFTNSINFNKPASGQTATWIGYDAAGRVATNRAENVTFDANGAFTSKTDLTGDGTSSPLAARTWSYVNGTDPWWIICTDEDGKVRRYDLDAFGRTNQIQEVDGGNTYLTTLKYDLAGNLTSIVNHIGETNYYAYDDAGRLVATADPYLGQWTYQRDYAGQLRVQTDARGDVVSNSYVNPSTGNQDPLGRLQVQVIYGTNYATHTLSVTSNLFTYDSSDDGNYKVYPGLLYKVADSEGWEKNGYDNRGRLTNTTRYLNINGKSYTTSYAFNDGDKVTLITYPNSSGLTITNSYFAGGSLNQVSRSGGNNYYTANATSYDEFDHLTGFSYGNGLTTARSYYSLSKRLQSISSGSGGSIFTRTYQYTAGGDVNFLNGTGATNVIVTYDNLHRIKSYTGLSGSYGYDAVGNMTTNIESGSTLTYNYGARRLQAVKTVTGTSYSKKYLYDQCGNMIVRKGDTTNSQALMYDAQNRLTRFSQAGMVVVEYGYAYDGTRLWKRVNQSATNVQVWIGNIYEEKGGRTLLHVFADGQQVCTFETNSALAVTGGDTNKVGYYYHQDNLNSSTALSDSSQSQVEMNVYYPFGRAKVTTPQAGFQVSRRFTGQVLDAETGLYYFNARYYDPELGRFIQSDIVIPDFSDPQSYNHYSYVRNNPLRLTDPTGHSDVNVVTTVDVPPGLTFDWINNQQQDTTTTVSAPSSGSSTPVLSPSDPNASRQAISVVQTGPAAIDALTIGSGIGDLNSTFAQQVGQGQAQVFLTVMPLPGLKGFVKPSAERAVGEVSAATPIGRSGNPINVVAGANKPAAINGIDYSAHALDQMQSRGIMPSVVQNTLKTGRQLPGNLPRTSVFYDAVNDVRVVVNPTSEKIITVIPGKP